MKYPGRIAKYFCVLNLARFYFGWGDKDRLFAQVSRRFGYRLAPIVLSKGEYAIDVDEPRSHRITEKLLAARAA